MQLLTVGKSIERINDANPYRVVEQGMLPNFGTEEAAPVWGTTGTSAGETPALPVAPTPDPFGPAVAPAPAAASSVAPAPAPRPAARRWVTGHRKSKSPQELVQRELALRTISVVRNDLSEADLEIRPALGVPGPVTQGNLFARPAQDERSLGMKRSWVKRLRERITGFWK